MSADDGDHEPPGGRGFSTPSWSWLLAAVVLVAFVVIGFTLLRGALSGGEGERGARGLETGTVIPPFAAPLVSSTVDGDVNLARKADSGGAGRVPACSVRMRGVVTSCRLVAQRPVVLMFATTTGRCTGALDTLERARRAIGRDVQVAAVAIRGDRERWRELVARWRFPVLYDRDGGLTSAFAVEVCPQTTLIERGGRVAGTIIGEVPATELVRRAAVLGDGRSMGRR
ncbi:MAG: hypothetical protein V9E83_02420 [Baekduia sp.]